MTLLHFDGFDLGDWAARYSTSGSSFSVNTSTRLGSGRCVQTSGSSTLTVPIAAASDVYVGFAFSRASGTASTSSFLALFGDAGATMHMNLAWSNPSTLTARRGSTVVASASVPEPAGAWVYIEMWATVADAGGRCVVKIDGATVIDFTGDTKNGGTATTIDRVTIGNQPGGTAFNAFYDDFYICDSSGSAPHNTFLGPVRVFTLAPSGAGTDTAMTPSAGSNFQCVDEQPYSATDYVTGSTGQRDTYTMGDLPASPGTIFAAQTVAIAKKTDAGALSLKTAVRSGGTLYTGTATALGTADGTVRTVRTTDPATGAAWTTAGVNAAEAGAEVV